MPEIVDELLKWSANDPMNLLPVVTDSPWELTVKDNKSKKITKAKR